VTNKLKNQLKLSSSPF